MKTVRRMLALFVATAVMIGILFVPDLGMRVKAEEAISLSGSAHVQTYGDAAGKIVNQNGVQTLVLGTRGQAKRVESVTISFVNNTGYDGTLQYIVHCQSYGWMSWKKAGVRFRSQSGSWGYTSVAQTAGTSGEGKRLEAIRMRLTGELAKHYDVRYRVHVQTYGDQNWVTNGKLAGTVGQGKRLEEIQVQIVPKTTVSTATETEKENYVPTVKYKVHRQTYGWDSAWITNGKTAGTVGQAKRLEAISIALDSGPYQGGIEYSVHAQTHGWMSHYCDGETAGTVGEAKRLEAIRINLTGEIADYYDVYYRVHMQSMGWLKWVKNGEYSGSSGLAKRLEAIQIKLVKKGDAAPSDADVGNPEYGYIDTSVWEDMIRERMRNKTYSGLGNDIVAYAEQFIGTPYVWGGEDLIKGTDCSGFTMKVYEHFGYRLYHGVKYQYTQGRFVALEDAQPGDLFIYKTADKSSFFHVEMYCGNAEIIGNAGRVSKKDMFDFGYPDYVVRIIP